jgi:hypothetical protein
MEDRRTRRQTETLVTVALEWEWAFFFGTFFLRASPLRRAAVIVKYITDLQLLVLL